METVQSLRTFDQVHVCTSNWQNWACLLFLSCDKRAVRTWALRVFTLLPIHLAITPFSSVESVCWWRQSKPTAACPPEVHLQPELFLSRS